MHDEAGMVSSPFMTRPESEQWFCSLRLSVLEGDVKSRSLQRAFGWDKPIPGLVLAVQLVSLSKKFEVRAYASRKMGFIAKDRILDTCRISHVVTLVCNGSCRRKKYI